MVKSPPASAGDVRDARAIPGSGRFPWRGAWQPTPVSLPGESHGQRSLVGDSPRGHKDLDTPEATQRTHIAHKAISGSLFNRRGRSAAGVLTQASLLGPQLRVEEGQRGHRPVQQLQGRGGERRVPPHQPDVVGRHRGLHVRGGLRGWERLQDSAPGGDVSTVPACAPRRHPSTRGHTCGGSQHGSEATALGRGQAHSQGGGFGDHLGPQTHILQGGAR